MWDGTLSGAEFQSASKLFLNVWNSQVELSKYQWTWQERADTTAGGYLTLEDVVLEAVLDENGDDNHNQAEEDYIEEEESAPDATTLTILEKQLCRCSYHVVYSESYKVPTLYFRSYHSDGRPVNWMNVKMPSEVGEQRWTFLTQEDHPYLHRPWFMLHPCGTGSILALILSDKGNKAGALKLHSSLDAKPQIHSTHGADVCDQYISAWLSFVGPVAKLPVPLALFKSPVLHHPDYDEH